MEKNSWNWLQNDDFSPFFDIRPIGQLHRIFGRIISAETGRIFGIGRTLIAKKLLFYFVDLITNWNNHFKIGITNSKLNYVFKIGKTISRLNCHFKIGFNLLNLLLTQKWPLGGASGNYCVRENGLAWRHDGQRGYAHAGARARIQLRRKSRKWLL